MNTARDYRSADPDVGVLPQAFGVSVAEMAAGRLVSINRGIRYVEVIDDGGQPFFVRLDGSSNGRAITCRVGDMIPVLGGERIHIMQNGSAPASALAFIGWNSQDGLVRAMARGTTRTVNGNGKSTTPRGHNAPTRLALAAGAASHSLSADAAYAIVRAGGSNAAAAYISNSDANVAVATTRWEKLQAEGTPVYSGFSYLGTAGDFLYVWEYKS